MNNKKHGLLTTVSVLLTVCLLAFWPAWANDLNKGYTFAVNEHNVTGTKINNLVDLASINTTFLTDKSAETSPQGADLFLMYSAAGGIYKKCSLSSLLLANNNLITGQSEDFAPSTNDYVLTYSTANSAMRKATMQNAVFTNNGLINLQPRSTNAPLPGALFLLSSNGVYTTYALTNIFQEWWRWMPFSTNSPTNFLLSVHAAPTNLDGLLIWDSVGKTNKATTLIGLLTNLPTVAPITGLTNTDFIPIVSTATNANNPFGTNNTISRVVLTNLIRSYVSGTVPVPTANGVTTFTHGLPSTPQFLRVVLVLTNTATFGYSQNDEIELAGVFVPASSAALLSPSMNATTIYLACGTGTASWTIDRKDTGAGGVSGTITKSDWNLKVYAKYFAF